MSNLVCHEQQFPAMTDEAVSKVRAVESFLREVEQVPIQTTHHFHAGLYARTISLKKGMVITGALVKIPTLVIVSGDASVFIGGETIRVTGYKPVPASAGRKQIIYAHEDTDLTMLFASDAKSVEEAESQFTDECDLLVSRTSSNDVVIFTG